MDKREEALRIIRWEVTHAWSAYELGQVEIVDNALVRIAQVAFEYYEKGLSDG